MKKIIGLIKYIPRKIRNFLLKGIISEIEEIKTKTVQTDFLMKLIDYSLDKQFFSQYYQDMIAYLFLKRKADGFCIDIGAHDGVTLSNSYFFELLGWKCICIEPLPDIFLKLQKNRKCELINAAVTDKCIDGAVFTKVLGPDMLSGLNSDISNSHKKRIKSEKGTVEYINVKTITFDAIMQNHPDVAHVDFLSIDVEGGELTILKTINFKKYSFGIITIENNEHGNILSKYMNEQGYRVFCNAGCDIMFIKA